MLRCALGSPVEAHACELAEHVSSHASRQLALAARPILLAHALVHERQQGARVLRHQLRTRLALGEEPYRGHHCLDGIRGEHMIIAF